MGLLSIKCADGERRKEYVEGNEMNGGERHRGSTWGGKRDSRRPGVRSTRECHMLGTVTPLRLMPAKIRSDGASQRPII